MGPAALLAHDREMMALAIELGASARGTTGDNPFVGSVIVAGGSVIGRGYTGPPGAAHAEVAAMADAAAHGRSLVGATLYTTVEPCTFYGRTPACSTAIVAGGLARVVIGIRDPHPRVDGQGVLALQHAGLEVREGVCDAEVRDYLSGWLRQRYAEVARARPPPSVAR